MIPRILAALVLLTAATIPGTGKAHASAPSFCGELGGDWDGQYCHTSVTSERNAVRDIKVAVPDDLVDNPTTGPVIRDYLRTLVNNWRNANSSMAADSYGEENFEVFRHASLLSAVFHEAYHADGPKPNNAYRTFTFDMASGRRVQLADLTTSNPLTAIPHWRNRLSRRHSTRHRRRTTRAPTRSSSTGGRRTRSTPGRTRPGLSPPTS